MNDPMSQPDTPTDELSPAPRPAPLQMLGATNADECHDGVCAVPTDDGS